MTMHVDKTSHNRTTTSASNKPVNGVTRKQKRNERIRRMKKGKLGINEKMLGIKEFWLV